ncbi:helix-hairpin-helix domain-containing protein [Actinoplanes derwentensis]|uniref:Helix-hairpin-helix motif-containing protein n=1 Tax=Actinoplanes derwentensis TaxID=113562 RepID=A0A1H1ULF0_9ACTN|nr:helix-hairpin-helix domain-containing protein [Actinoplanes derwentensis]GID88101.1 hypothetical protein Ade03nite_70250 [Actinoplanes derwentensis]SDS73347.1 Helix-hairpin-helix motif-containing protein [Actinoplanes derwentensis]
MTWTPPDGHPHGVKPARGPSRVWWRIGNSAWLLLPILSFGCLSAAGFCYVGIRARRPMWWVSGIVYSVLANVFFFVGPEVPDDSVWSMLLALGVLFTWMISVVHALIINAEWLRWRAAQHPWYLPPQQPMPWPAQAPLPPQVQGLVPAPGQFYATPAYPTPTFGTPPASPYPAPQPYIAPAGPAFQQAATTTPGHSLPPPYPDAPSPVPADPVPAFGEQFGPRNLFDHPAPPPQPSGLVDVNRAGPDEFAALPGFSAERAATVVSARLARGGFHSVADFLATAGLAPHEFVAVRDRLTCTPPATPQHVQDQPFGRIVDV